MKRIFGFITFYCFLLLLATAPIDSSAQVIPGGTCPIGSTATICEATTRGPICHHLAMPCDVATVTPMCIDGNMHFVPCASLAKPDCEMKVHWVYGSPEKVRVVELTDNPGCRDEALRAASETTTRIIRLQSSDPPPPTD